VPLLRSKETIMGTAEQVFDATRSILEDERRPITIDDVLWHVSIPWGMGC